jgi:RNA polymerase sigma-70 factor, ECF subfamily
MNPRKHFGRVYDAQVTKIYRYVRLKVSSKEVAEDLTAQVFERGWVVYREGLDPESERPEVKNLKAFLYQLARHAVADYYRVESRQEVVHLGDRDLEEEGSSLSDKAAGQEEASQILAALSKINPDYQDLIIQRYLNGLSLEEIADHSNRSVGAVKTALHRARETLKKELEADQV